MANEGHYVYMIECKDQSLYTGYTTNIRRRVQMHTDGKGAKYTRGRGPFTLMFSESHPSKERALQREYEIKQLSRAAKLELIKDRRRNPNGPHTK